MTSPMSDSPYSCDIKPEWLDYNGHLNVAYYVLIFDGAEEALFEKLGLGERVAKETAISWMVLENHITYDNEVSLGQQVEISVRLVDHDHKRMHLYLEMHTSGDDGYLASTLEQMVICADLDTRKSRNFPEDVMSNIDGWAQEQIHLPRPENTSRIIGIRHK